MARIPDSELDRIKREVDLEALVVASGVKLTRQGEDLVGLCPFHDDREPSLVVSPGKRPPLWHCLGACQAGGTAIDWVMRREGVSFREAVVRLSPGIADATTTTTAPPVVSTVAEREAADADAEEPDSDADADPDASLPPVVEPWMDDRELLSAVVGYYHASLLESPEALAYLERRGLADPALVTEFRLGYANRTLGTRLPSRRTQLGGELRRRLEALGVLRERSGHEHLAGRIVVPVLGAEGEVLGLYGRVVRANLRAGTPDHLNLPGPLRGVFNLAGIAGAREVIVCEALLDALTLWSAGFRHVTALRGVEAPAEELLAVLRAGGTERVLVAFDRDDAGDRAAEAFGAKVLAAGIECWRVLFPRGMDANAYACRVKPADKSLGLVLRQAQWMGKGAPVRRVPADASPASMPIAAVLKTAAMPTIEPQATTTVLKTAEGTPPAPAAPPSVAPGTSAAAATQAAALAVPAAPSSAAPAPLLASPAPPAPGVDVAVEVVGEDLLLWFGDRRYRVRGLAKNLSYEVLKVNLLASRGDAFHVDTLDLYAARQRLAFVKQAAVELAVKEDVVRADLGRVLLKLEELQHAAIRKTLEPEPAAPAMTAEERAEALALLTDPDLPARILEDFDRCGVVGELTNKLVGYLVATSRKLAAPLAVVIQSSSAAGKTALMEAVLAMMPEEERIKYSAMTGQSLFYMSEQDLKHKILALVEEEGAERAAYALKLLQSEGELTIASTGKDPQSGRLVTHEYRVEGPVSILLTTTAIAIDEELLNRCLVLTVDEEREQTRAIHRFQRERRTLEGYARKRQRERILRLHQNAQRLLEPLPVINPFAPRLQFLDTQTRARRDHEKYLNLIEAIALLHQHQRPRLRAERPDLPAEYIEVTPRDVELANRLAHEVLGRSLDELPPQTRRLLGRLDAFVTQACATMEIDRVDFRFQMREVRAVTGWGHTQLKIHLERLVDLEYVVVHRASRGQAYVYELVYDGGGQDGRPFLPKLIDADLLRAELGTFDANRSGLEPGWSGQNGGWSAPGRPQVGAESAGGRGRQNGESPKVSAPLLAPAAPIAANAHLSRNGRHERTGVVGHAS